MLDLFHLLIQMVNTSVWSVCNAISDSTDMCIKSLKCIVEIIQLVFERLIVTWSELDDREDFTCDA